MVENSEPSAQIIRFFLTFGATYLSGKWQRPRSEQFELRPSVHLPFQSLQTVDVAFRWSVAPDSNEVRARLTPRGDTGGS